MHNISNSKNLWQRGYIILILQTKKKSRKKDSAACLRPPSEPDSGEGSSDGETSDDSQNVEFISKKLGPNDYASNSHVATFFFPSTNLSESVHISVCLRFNLKILVLGRVYEPQDTSLCFHVCP